MAHLVIVPVVLPLMAAMLQLLLTPRGLAAQRPTALVVALLNVACAFALVAMAAEGGRQEYAIGSWPAPFGIVLVLDRLSAMMVALTALLGFFCLLYACQGDDERGPHFHPLLLMQLAGLQGAFLTGDVFNLFVFFEILLLASYTLLIYGGGADRVRAGLHYVVLNLVGSALFLIGVGVLYGVTGTLNMTHMAARVAELSGARADLARAGGLVLLSVLLLKAAVVPLYFWLPRAYGAATAPVAALFAIMTKVGIYAVLRIYAVVFGAGAGHSALLAEPWILPIALATIALSLFGALASRSLRALAGHLVVVSVGTMLAAVGLFSADGVAAALYYLLHSTLIMAVVFLLADLVARQRGPELDRLYPCRAIPQRGLLGTLFFISAIAVAGLPPLSGFLGKVAILQAVDVERDGLLIWWVLLASGFVTLVALSRAGSSLFWKTTGPAEADSAPKAPSGRLVPVIGLLSCVVALSVFAEPALVYTRAAATDLLATPPLEVDISASAAAEGRRAVPKGAAR